MIILDKKRREYYETDAEEATIQSRRDLKAHFATEQSLFWPQSESYGYDREFGLKMARTFKRGLSHPLVHDELANVLQRKVGYLEDALRTQRMHYNSVRRQNASLKTELDILKNRVEFLYELRRRESVKEHMLAKKTRTRVTPSDLEWIRKTLGPKISKEDIVRAIRSTRDSR